MVPAAADGKKKERRHRGQRDARRFLGRCRPAFPRPRGGVARTQPVNYSPDDESRWRTAERRLQASPCGSHVHVGSLRPQTRIVVIRLHVGADLSERRQRSQIRTRSILNCTMEIRDNGGAAIVGARRRSPSCSRLRRGPRHCPRVRCEEGGKVGK